MILLYGILPESGLDYTDQEVLSFVCVDEVLRKVNPRLEPDRDFLYI